MLRSSLPGGRAMISMPGFQNVGFVLQHHVGHAAAEQLAEQLLEMAADGGEGVHEELAAVGVDLVDDLFEAIFWPGQIVELGLQGGGARFEFVQLLEGIEVDAAEAAELAAQVVDFVGNEGRGRDEGRGVRGEGREEEVVSGKTPPGPPFERGGNQGFVRKGGSNTLCCG